MENTPKPNDKISKTTGKLELRKLWSVPQAEFIYALFLEVETTTYELKEDNGKMVIDESKPTGKETTWQTPQGYVGNEEWAKKTADHFGIAFPAEEYKADEKEDK